MAICTHTVECGPLGEVELTISYKFRPGHRETRLDPSEPESATIYWIKIGGIKGIEVEVDDDYITDEIIPACVADWHGEAESAAQQYEDAVRIERMERELERQAA